MLETSTSDDQPSMEGVVAGINNDLPETEMK
jgi:hypothetical protein